MKRIKRISNISYILYVLALGLVMSSCNGAKMSVADEQMERGEYFDAAKTYRKIYNKLKPREQRAQRAEVAYKMAECHRRLGQDARAAAAYQNALRYGYPDSSIVLCLAQSLHGRGPIHRLSRLMRSISRCTRPMLTLRDNWPAHARLPS